MKKLSMYFALVILAVMMVGCVSQKQTSREKKAMKIIKKEVRHYVKDGWKSLSEPPLEYQLMTVYKMRGDVDEKGCRKYIEGNATSVDETYDSALILALNMSKFSLAEKIETEIAELIKNNLHTPSQRYAIMLVESVAASTNLMVQKLGRIITPVNVYRELPNGYVEVRVISFYSHDLAMDIFKQILLEDLEKKDECLAKQLSQILN